MADLQDRAPKHLALGSASEFWREAHRHAGGGVSRQNDDGVEEAFWQEHAPGYDKRSPLAECATELIADVRALIAPGQHLLEIGAGPGAFTRRLAHRLSLITVIEPSAAMRTEFRKLWDGPGIVEVVPLKWEDTPSVQADIVFGANAFYRIPDIVPAILKMNASARRRVALVQTVGLPHARPVSVMVDGEITEQERADVICGVLHELGIAHRRRDYEIQRPDAPSRAALIDWATDGLAGTLDGPAA